MQTVWEKILGSVGETVFRFASDDSGMQEMHKIGVEGDLSEAYDDTNARQSPNLSRQMRGAVADLLRKGFIAGRCATDHGRDPGMPKFETVVAGNGAWFAGEAQVMQDWIHEVAGSVTGKRTACTIRSMGAGRQAKDKNSGSWVAKSGNGASPIGLVLVGAPPGFSDASTVFAQAGAALAGDDGFVNLLEEGRGDLCACGCHCIP
jgi:hypothetical protein